MREEFRGVFGKNWKTEPNSRNQISQIRHGANLRKRTTLLLTGIAVLGVFFGARSVMLAPRPTPQVTDPVPVKTQSPTPVIVETSPVDVQQEVTRYPTVEKYLSAGTPNPLSHRLGEPLFPRKVSSSKRKAIIERDGGCCLVCGSTVLLEVDHRIALMNGGDNSDASCTMGMAEA